MPTQTQTQSKTTTDHETIRRWAEKRGAVPSTAAPTRGAKDAGVIRLGFPGFAGERALQKISWAEFFDKFDKEGLAFVFQEKTAAGKTSSFNQLVKRTPISARGTRSRSAGVKKTETKRAGGAKRTTKRAATKRAATKRAGATTKRPAGTKRTSAAKRTGTTKRVGATKRPTKRIGGRSRARSGG